MARKKDNDNVEELSGSESVAGASGEIIGFDESPAAAASVGIAEVQHDDADDRNVTTLREPFWLGELEFYPTRLSESEAPKVEDQTLKCKPTFRAEKCQGRRQRQKSPICPGRISGYPTNPPTEPDVKISLIRFLGVARFHTTRLQPTPQSASLTLHPLHKHKRIRCAVPHLLVVIIPKVA